MNGHHDPDDVLAAVRQMEEDLEAIRRRARGGASGLENQITELREESARERAALVEDMRMVVEVVAKGWTRTAHELEALRAEMGELRDMARRFAGAQLELKLAGPPPAESAEPTEAADTAAERLSRKPETPSAPVPEKGPARRVLPYPGRQRTAERDVASANGRYERPLYPVAEGGRAAPR